MLTVQMIRIGDIHGMIHIGFIYSNRENNNLSGLLLHYIKLLDLDKNNMLATYPMIINL